MESTVTLEDSVQVGIEHARKRLVNESHSVEKDGDESVESRVDLAGIFELRNEGLVSLQSRESAYNTTNKNEQAYRIMVTEIKERVFDVGNIVTGDGLQEDANAASMVVVGEREPILALVSIQRVDGNASESLELRGGAVEQTLTSLTRSVDGCERQRHSARRSRETLEFWDEDRRDDVGHVVLLSNV